MLNLHFELKLLLFFHQSNLYYDSYINPASTDDVLFYHQSRCFREELMGLFSRY